MNDKDVLYTTETYNIIKMFMNWTDADILTIYVKTCSPT